MLLTPASRAASKEGRVFSGRSPRAPRCPCRSKVMSNRLSQKPRVRDRRWSLAVYERENPSANPYGMGLAPRGRMSKWIFEGWVYADGGGKLIGPVAPQDFIRVIGSGTVQPT